MGWPSEGKRYIDREGYIRTRKGNHYVLIDIDPDKVKEQNIKQSFDTLERLLKSLDEFNKIKSEPKEISLKDLIRVKTLKEYPTYDSW